MTIGDISKAPLWAKVDIQNQQYDSDAKYADELKAYDHSKADWVAVNSRNRELNLPYSDKPLIPLHTVWGWDDLLLSIISDRVREPDVAEPTLPLPPVTDPGAPLKSGAMAYDQLIEGMLRTLVQAVGQMRADIAAIKAGMKL